MNSQEYIEVKIKLTPYTDQLAEIIEAELAELPYESFTNEAADTGDCGYVNAYIQKESYDQQALKVVLSGIEDVNSDIEWSANLIPAQNWNAQWESNFEPCVIENLCTIKAPFHKDLEPTRFNITISPEMAFGTGHHQTTYMMCKSLIEFEDKVKDSLVTDLGCGTAILAILAAQLGAKKVTGIDIDAVAVASARENVRLNDLEEIVHVHYGDASRLQRNNNDILLANINRNILVNDMNLYAGSLHTGGLLFTSGYYEEDMPIVRKAAEDNGLNYLSHMTRENWCCTIFKKNL